MGPGSRYRFNREALLSIFRALLEARELSFEDEPALEEAVSLEGWRLRFFGLPHYSSQSADRMPRYGYLRWQSGARRSGANPFLSPHYAPGRRATQRHENSPAQGSGGGIRAEAGRLRVWNRRRREWSRR
jgi:hypothetical protein